MTPLEAVTLVEYVANGCPSMRMGTYTADVWYSAGLNDIPADIATEAAANLIRVQPYIGLHDLITEAEAVARARKSAVTKARLEADDPNRYADHTKPALAVAPDDPETAEAKAAERRRVMAEAFAKAKVGRAIPKVDKRHPDTIRAEARRELDEARDQQSGEAS